MIHKEDISFTNEILSSINDPRKSLLIVDVYRLAQNEAQADRVMNTLVEYEATRKSNLALEKTCNTAVLIDIGGAEYIFAQQQEREITLRQEREFRELSIQEIKRNRRWAWAAFLVSLVSIGISIISLCVK